MRLILFLLVIFNTFLAAKAQSFNDNILKVKITFDGMPSSANATKAKLKYNKDFAYSLILDDGRSSAFTSVFPLLNGGLHTENNITYPGLFYTDGCGNTIPFRAGIGWYSVNSNGIDIHEGTAGYITWDELEELYNAGWDILNHSYSHASGKDDTDYEFEISKNQEYVKAKTGIIMRQFVIPSGDTNYTDFAFRNSMKVVYNQSIDFDGAGGYRIDTTLNNDRIKIWRKFLVDTKLNEENVTVNIDEAASKSTNGQNYWYTDFTHGINKDSSNGGLKFSTFEYYMSYIENTYGKGGKDNIWMAPSQEVFEYIMVRDNIILNSQVEGNELELTLNLENVPDSLRRYALTLSINADKDIKSIEVFGNPEYTYNATGNKKLLNLEWDKNLVITSTTTNIRKEKLKAIIYPNPVGAESNLNIEVNEATPYENIRIEFMDISGKVVFQSTLKADGAGKVYSKISEANLSKGIYIVNVATSNTFSKTKLVIQ